MSQMIDNTEQYINTFNYHNNHPGISKWMHDHPRAMRVMQVSALVFAGIAAAGAIASTSAAPLCCRLSGTDYFAL